ncbi:DUF4298 domain-containing protein [Peptoniphilaceae bacterium SGI.131]
MKEQVIKFEEILNDTQAVLLELERALDRLEENYSAFKELKEYYGSDEYLKDMAIADNTDDYKDIRCGVLSEDGVYNIIGDSYDSYIRMLEVATRMLKEY